MYQISRWLLPWLRILPGLFEVVAQRDPTVDSIFFAQAVELA